MAKERDRQKEERQRAIQDLVREKAIRTQMDLLEALREAGFTVTQATISRDIRELQIGKAVDESGSYHYTAGLGNENLKRFEMIFAESALSADVSGSIVLVKCLTGMANAACEMFDRESENWGDVVGTLSGDNTFLILMRSEGEAKALCNKLLSHYIRRPAE